MGVSPNDLTINTGGVLNGNNKKITVSGNLTIDGIYYGGGQDFDFTGGPGTSFDGSGVMNLGPNKKFKINGSTSIASDADLYIEGQVEIQNDIVVTNNGTIYITAQIAGKNANSSPGLKKPVQGLGRPVDQAAEQ